LRGKAFFRLAAAALALAFLLSGTADGWADAPEPSSSSPKVDAEVLHTLENEKWVEVFVALREPPAATVAPLNLPTLRQQVAADQGDVLSGLTDADFQLLDRYDAIPSLFGRVSAAGIAKLAAHPRVARIYRPPELHFTLAQSVPLINADDAHTATRITDDLFAGGYPSSATSSADGLDQFLVVEDAEEPAMARYVLGINCYLHDSSCALLKDDRVIFASEEERFSRIKKDARFPRRAIQAALD
jgi:hypothetical protein